MSQSGIGTFIGFMIAIAVMLAIMLLPAIVAFKRNHAYKWIILVLSLFSWTGFVWVIAFVWAVWPSDKSLIDPVAGNVTGLGRRNPGDTLGGAVYGMSRGYQDERDADVPPFPHAQPRRPV